MGPWDPGAGLEWPRGMFFQPLVLPRSTFLAGAVFSTKNNDVRQLLSKRMSKQMRWGVDLSGEIRPNFCAGTALTGLSSLQNGWMATRLVTTMCELGFLAVPGPASTPLGFSPKTKDGVEDHLVTIVSAGTK